MFRKDSAMSCPVCASWSTQREFPAEAFIHFPGWKNVDNPGVSIFPKLLVCPDCGFTRFTGQKSKMGLLRVGLQANTQLPRV